MDLGFIWLAVIAFCIILYVILDGFTLGIGILFPFLNSSEKDIATSVVLPTWDGNQTWLVLSLAAFYGMFPLAFSFIIPKIYMQAVLLVAMLLLRGICFEFRLKAKRGIKNWDKLFFISSILATFLQGSIVGHLVAGYPMKSSAIGFQILTGIALVLGYMLLGATRLILKTEGQLLEKARKMAKKILVGLIILMLIIGVATVSFINIPYLNGYKILTLGEFFVLTIISFIILVWFLNIKESHAIPYWATVSVFICTYVSMVTLMYPYIIPYKMTYTQAEASQTTLLFTLIPAIIMIPLLLLYTGYAYYVFRGKVKENISY